MLACKKRPCKRTVYAVETFETSVSASRRCLAMPIFMQNNTLMLLGKHRTPFSPKAVDTPAKCHRIRVVMVYTHFVLRKAVAQAAVNSQRMEIKPLHLGTTLIPAQGALSIKKEGWLHPTVRTVGQRV